jgi:DNA modification methylase
MVFSKGSFSPKKLNDKDNTINRDQFMEWTKSVWHMNTESAKKVGHPAPFPIELPYRLIQLYTFSRDIILDPLMGSGSTAIAAIKSGRKYIGYDNNQEYIKLAEDRIALYKMQLGLHIYDISLKVSVYLRISGLCKRVYFSRFGFRELNKISSKFLDDSTSSTIRFINQSISK